MLEIINNIDNSLLLLINQSFSNPIFDFIMPLFDNVKNWIPFILILWIGLIYFDKKIELSY